LYFAEHREETTASTDLNSQEISTLKNESYKTKRDLSKLNQLFSKQASLETSQ
jgi:hypothetical protein